MGKAYQKLFPDAYIYDEPQGIGTREETNKCNLAIVCVPTDLDRGKLDMSIVENVVSWLETDLILIKSALQPGTVDRLVEETQKNIAVSVEMIGEGKYFTPYWRYPHPQDPTMHGFLIIGGDESVAVECAEILWDRMSPDINIQIVSAIEAEICKLMENGWGALKVTFANAIYDICAKYGAEYMNVLQAWGVDGRTEKMHMRVLSYKRGWKSKCYDKDVAALASLDKSGLFKRVMEANDKHLRQ